MGCDVAVIAADGQPEVMRADVLSQACDCPSTTFSSSTGPR
jgi:hypothetical protein